MKNIFVFIALGIIAASLVSCEVPYPGYCPPDYGYPGGYYGPPGGYYYQPVPNCYRHGYGHALQPTDIPGVGFYVSQSGNPTFEVTSGAAYVDGLTCPNLGNGNIIYVNAPSR